jgi:virginiamycin B lyase
MGWRARGRTSGRARLCRSIVAACLGIGLLALPVSAPLVGATTQGGVFTDYTDASLVGPTGIVAGPDGALWFANESAGSIGRITTNGTFTYYTDPGLVAPNAITAGPDGALWFTNVNGLAGSIGRITAAGTFTYYTDPSISYPYDITVGPDGALWFTNFRNDSIGRITTSGTVTNYTDPSISWPTGITTGPDGALWFTNESTAAGLGSIGRITTAGNVTHYGNVSSSYPVDITAGPDGALWFTNHGTSSNSSIGRITIAGTVTHYTDPSIVGPTYITPGPDGALWFTNQNTIGRITTAGTVTSHTDPNSNPNVAEPAGITTGPDGALWFTNDTQSPTYYIGRVTPVEAPSAPAKPTASPGNAQARVTWVAPANNGSAINQYIVTPYTGTTAHAPRTFNSTAVSQIITGLTNGLTYTFKVKAHNSVGTGPNSVASNAIKIGTPPAPAKPKVAPGNGQVRVNWVAPTNSGSAITGYVVTPFTGTTAHAARTFNSTALAQNVTGLTNGTSYTFEVAAKNAVGTGPMSAASLVVVPTAQPTLKVMMNATIGQPIIVNSYGMTVYMYAPDADSTPTISNVNGGLGTAWPYVTWSGPLTVGSPLVVGKATGNIQPDNTRLVGYNGHLLYTFVNDHVPGDVTGQGLINQFFVLDASGHKIP